MFVSFPSRRHFLQARAEDAGTLRHFTRATAMIPTDGIVRKTALSATRGAQTDLEKTRQIYDWIVAITYREPKVRGCGVGDIRSMLGHTYRIVVSDLLRRRPIWFGGTDRSQASMSLCYDWLGHKKTGGIRLAVMDMWKPFGNVTAEHAPQAAILFDKFHIMSHLGQALDKVRKAEYARLSGKDRRFIKGRKYTLLSNRENLTLEGGVAQAAAVGQKAAEHCLRAHGVVRSTVGLPQRNLGTALLRELARQLEVAAAQAPRRVCANDRPALGWNRRLLQARVQISLGFVEGLNNKIRVIQRRAYGLRDEEYLRLKILTCMLPKL